MLTSEEETALTIAAEDLVFAPGDAEVRAVLVLDPGESYHYRLTLVKGLMVRLLQAEQRIQRRLVEAVRFIEETNLWKFDADDEGNGFRSMTAYLPYLLDQLKKQGYVDSLGVRQMRTWLAAERVLVQGGLMDWEQVEAIGIGVVEKVLQATAYDAKTGAIPETTAPGSKKLNRGQVKDLLDEVMDDRENWTAQAVAKEADERRGVTRKNVYIRWATNWYTGEYYVDYVDLYMDDMVRSTNFTLEQAQQIMRLLNATSNLETLSGS